MLTRDISLDDVLLGLIDNCLDRALRLADGGDVHYGKQFVKIKLSKDQFSIEDNCGGIPRNVLQLRLQDGEAKVVSTAPNSRGDASANGLQCGRSRIEPRTACLLRTM